MALFYYRQVSTHNHRPYGLSRVSSSNQDSSSGRTHVQSVSHDWIPTGNHHLSSTAIAKRQFPSTIWSNQLPLKYAVKCSLLPAVSMLEVSWPGNFSVTVIKPNSEDGHKHFRKALVDNFSTFDCITSISIGRGIYFLHEHDRDIKRKSRVVTIYITL